MKSLTWIPILGTLLLSGPVTAGSLVDLSIYDRSSHQTLPIYWHNGQAYVAGKPGNEYQISLRNRTGEEILAVVSVDGINVLSGQTARSSQGGYILSNYQDYDILGWRKSNSETAAFYFTSLPDSYAGRTARPGNVGVIGAAIFRRYQPPPPEYSSRSVQPNADKAEIDGLQAPKRPAAAPLAMESDKIGTGHGRREYSPVQEAEFRRASSAPAEVLTIYYDSYANLVAQGIIPTSSRAPQAFNDIRENGRYVPDPPPYQYRWPTR